MNNEPVAWFEQDPDMKSIWYQSDQDNPNAIPLYTHPAEHDLGIAEAIGFEKGYKAASVKELTDEEIADFEWAIKNVLNFSQSEKVVGLDNVIRAILRKAQEK